MCFRDSSAQMAQIQQTVVVGSVVHTLKRSSLNLLRRDTAEMKLMHCLRDAMRRLEEKLVVSVCVEVEVEDGEEWLQQLLVLQQYEQLRHLWRRWELSVGWPRHERAVPVEVMRIYRQVLVLWDVSAGSDTVLSRQAQVILNSKDQIALEFALASCFLLPVLLEVVSAHLLQV